LGWSPEAQIRWVDTIAAFAASTSIGHYSDGKLENVAFDIGQNLETYVQQKKLTLDTPKATQPARRRVLHVASAVYPTGGHSRLILNWIRNDDNSHHSLVLTRQHPNPVPDWLTREVLRSGGHLEVLPNSLTGLEKAASIRLIARQGFDLVVLHHHPN